VSSGVRFSLLQADQVVAHLVQAWSLDRLGAEVAGSVRRRCPTIGDVEFIAPLPAEGKPDPLHDAIAQTLELAGGLFQAEPRKTIGRPVRGFKPGFTACSLLIRPWGQDITCEIHRYTPRNKGWIEIMRTGPREFGIKFLQRWKQVHDIPGGDGGQEASIHGHLVDRNGHIVPVATEKECFEKVGWKLYAPEERARAVGIGAQVYA